MSAVKKFRSAAGSDRVLEVWKGVPSGTALVAVGDEDNYTDIAVNAIDLRDYLLEVFPLDDQKSAGPEDHPHDDGFEQLVDRATEAAAKAAGKAYLEAYAKAFSAALVEDRPLQVGDRVELIEDYGHRKAGLRGVVTNIMLTRGDPVGLVRFETGAASVAAYARRLRRVP